MKMASLEQRIQDFLETDWESEAAETIGGAERIAERSHSQQARAPLGTPAVARPSTALFRGSDTYFILCISVLARQNA